MFTVFAAERRERRAIAEAVAKPLRAQNWFSVVEAHDDAAAITHRRARSGDTPRSLTVNERAELMAHALLRRIVESGWPVGQPLGSETQLMKEYSVSRSVLRQAIRLLAQHEVVEMRRGPHGGWTVSSPDGHALVRTTSVYLEYRRMGPAAILFTRRTLEKAALRLAIERLDLVGEKRLRQLIQDETVLDGDSPPVQAQDFHRLVGELSLDPALQLFGGIVLALSVSHSTFSRRSFPDRQKVIQRVKRFHREIVDAMVARDTVRAERQLDRYFDGMQTWLI